METYHLLKLNKEEKYLSRLIHDEQELDEDFEFVLDCDDLTDQYITNELSSEKRYLNRLIREEVKLN